MRPDSRLAARVRFSRAAPVFLAAALTLTGALPGGTLDGAPDCAMGGERDTAQDLLFDNGYLKAMTPPASLVYGFEHSTSDEATFGKPFTDSVRLNLGEPTGEHKLNDVRLDIFPETRNRQIGPFFDVSGNPVIMVFLERDMHDTLRRVRASPVLFRNTVRKAMRDAAVIDDVDISLDGKTVSAKRVTIVPFAGEAVPPQLAELGGKRYQFTVSDAVPGGFYEIVSTLQDPQDGDRVLVSDRMTYKAMGQ
ncbi:MAG TPA: hypothetical protein VK862_02305 [Afifellaceae bacterium]|nr:hypothetical protein [Afifellaceae bacterium]